MWTFQFSYAIPRIQDVIWICIRCSEDVFTSSGMNITFYVFSVRSSNFLLWHNHFNGGTIPSKFCFLSRHKFLHYYEKKTIHLIENKLSTWGVYVTTACFSVNKCGWWNDFYDTWFLLKEILMTKAWRKIKISSNDWPKNNEPIWVDYLLLFPSEII